MADEHSMDWRQYKNQPPKPAVPFYTEDEVRIMLQIH